VWWTQLAGFRLRCFGSCRGENPFPLTHPLQLLYAAFADSEKTYSGLTDGCAKAGRAGCKLIEFTGDNVSGDEIGALLEYAHDVGYSRLILDNLTDPYFAVGRPGALPQRNRTSR